MKIKKIIMFILIIIIINFQIGIYYISYAESSSVNLVIYENTNEGEVEYDNENQATISGLETLDLSWKYTYNDKVYSESSKNLPFNVTWRVQQTSKDIASVSSSGRVLGVNPGDADIGNRTAGIVAEVKDNNENIITSKIIKIKVKIEEEKNINGAKEIYGDTSIKLPTAKDIINNFQNINKSHPRILADEDMFQLAIKYFDDENTRKTAGNEHLQYIDDVYKSILEKVKTTQTKIENVSENDKIFGQFSEMSTLTDSVAKDLTKDIELLGFAWRISNYRLKIANSSGNIEEIEKAQKETENSKKYANSAIREMIEVCEYDNWKLQDLDIGEISYPIALGYDWFYDYLDTSDMKENKEKIKKALVEKGIAEGNRTFTSISFQQRFKSNWSAVCFSGTGIAALAVFEEAPEKSSRLIADACKYVPIALNMYAPDGAWSEGTGYWGLAIRFSTYFIASLKNSIGTDYGLSDVKGLEEAIYYPIYLVGKSNLDNKECFVFNYGDATATGSAGATCKSSLFLLGNAIAEKYENNGKSYVEKANIIDWYKNKYTQRDLYDVADVKDLLWYPLLLSRYNTESKKLLKEPSEITETDITIKAGLTEDKFFSSEDELTKQKLAELGLMSKDVIYGRGAKVDVATFKKSYLDNTSIYAAIKGQNNAVSHRDLDAGTFVFDALGVRWAKDLGRASTYSGNRYSYYQKRAEGHNTIVINPTSDVDQNNNSKTIVNINKYESGESQSYAITDLSASYNETNATDNSVKRGIKLFNNKTRMIIRDEISLSKESDIYWFMHTDSDINIQQDGKVAILSQLDANGKKVYLKAEIIDEDRTNAKFSTMTQQPIDDSLKNVKNNIDYYNKNKNPKLEIQLNNTSQATINVVLTPIYSQSDYIKETPKIESLDKWKIDDDVKVNSIEIKENLDNQIVDCTKKIISNYNKFMLLAKFNPTNATNTEVSWSSSDTSIATVDKYGIVTPIKNGKVTITALAKDGSNVYGNCILEIESLEVNLEEYTEKDDDTQKYIKNINPNTDISEIKEKIKTNGEIKIYKGTKCVTSGKIETGMKIEIKFNGQSLEYIAVVKGDINGDGEVTVLDLFLINKYRLNKTNLEKEFFEAGDITNDGKADIQDLFKLNKYRLKKINEL